MREGERCVVDFFFSFLHTRVTNESSSKGNLCVAVGPHRKARRAEEKERKKKEIRKKKFKEEQGKLASLGHARIPSGRTQIQIKTQKAAPTKEMHSNQREGEDTAEPTSTPAIAHRLLWEQLASDTQWRPAAAG